MLQKIEQIMQEIADLKATSAEEAENLRIKYLSKKGVLNALMADFRNVAADQKKEVGMKINELKQAATNKINELKDAAQSQATTSTLPALPTPSVLAHAIH